jgi:hypothetical protein
VAVGCADGDTGATGGDTQATSSAAISRTLNVVSSCFRGFM